MRDVVRFRVQEATVYGYTADGLSDDSFVEIRVDEVRVDSEDDSDFEHYDTIEIERGTPEGITDTEFGDEGESWFFATETEAILKFEELVKTMIG